MPTATAKKKSQEEVRVEKAEARERGLTEAGKTYD